MGKKPQRAFPYNKMKRFSIWLLIVSFVSISSGCATTDTAKQEDVAQMRSSVSEELAAERENINSLKGKTEELQNEINNLSKTQKQGNREFNTALKQWRNQISSSTDAKIAALKNEISQLQKQVENTQKEIEAKLNILAEETVKENKAIRRQIKKLQKAAAYKKHNHQYTVKQGDTLSAIAKKFSVSVNSIMKANHLTSPNSIQTGQKIIIPGNR